MHVKFDESDCLTQEQVHEDEEIGMLRYGEPCPQQMQTLDGNVDV